MITSDNVWIVHSSRQGVMRPVKRKVINIVEEIGVEVTPLNDKFYFHYHVLNDSEWPYEVKIRDDMTYGTVVKHQNDDGTGAWLSTLFYSLNEEDAKGYYEREFKRFEHVYRKHRYFKYKKTGEIFIETDYDGYMHYARLIGEKHTTRLWDEECIEVLDYEGTAKPKPITGHHRQLDIICPECNNVMNGDECISMDNRIHERHILECTECKIEFEVALHIEVTYSSSTNIKKFLDKKNE